MTCLSQNNTGKGNTAMSWAGEWVRSGLWFPMKLPLNHSKAPPKGGQKLNQQMGRREDSDMALPVPLKCVPAAEEPTAWPFCTGLCCAIYTIGYSSIQTIPYCTVPYCIYIAYSTILHYTIPYYTILNYIHYTLYAIPYNTIYTILYYIYYTILYFTINIYTILQYTTYTILNNT